MLLWYDERGTLILPGFKVTILGGFKIWFGETCTCGVRLQLQIVCTKRGNIDGALTLDPCLTSPLLDPRLE